MERPRPQPNPEKRILKQLQEHMKRVKIPGTTGKEADLADQKLITKMRTEISDQQIDEAMKGWLTRRNEPPRS